MESAADQALSRDEFVEYFDIYTKYLLDKSNVLGVSPDTIKYGIQG